MLVRGKGEETLRFAFRMYDWDDSGFIGEVELDTVLQLCSTKKMSKSQLRRIFRGMDKDKDGRISYEEFVRALRDSNILIKCLLGDG